MFKLHNANQESQAIDQSAGMRAAALRLAPPALRRAASRPSTDDQLVAAVRDGEDAAFEDVFDRYHRPLLSFCRHMLGDRQEAEDAVQQAFLDAYRTLASSAKPIHLRPWLYTIARNRCISILRNRPPSAPIGDYEPATQGLAVDIEHREELREMLVDLARLPEDQRAALVLAELDSLSHKEIAHVVGCSHGKVKALVFQARSSLIASRIARDTPCREVREQLATLNGGALRRSRLRRHLQDCPGCQDFKAAVARQRQALAVLLPVVPTAGFKSAVLGGVGAKASAGVAAAGTAGGVASAVGGGLGAQLLAVGAVIVGLGAGAVLGEGTSSLSPDASRPASSQSGVAAANGRSTKGGPPAPATVSAGDRDQAGAISPEAPGPLVAPAGSTQAPSSSETESESNSSDGSSARDSEAGHHSDSTGLTGSELGAGLMPDTGGRSESSPGQQEITPGLAGTSPGLSGATPANGNDPPGQADTSPGKSEDTPNKSHAKRGKGGNSDKSSGKNGHRKH